MKCIFTSSPIGELLLTSTDKGICYVWFVEDNQKEKLISGLEKKFDKKIEFNTNAHLEKCKEQLQEYFVGTRKEFDISFDLSGSQFQQKIWKLLGEIPFGKTISYLDLSKKYGDVKAIRAIASANGENPLSIIIPCHRVIGTDGSLTGYAGGLARKQWLLQHEQDFSGSRQEKLF